VDTVSRVINFIITKKINGVINVGSGRGQSLLSIINLIGHKFKIKPIVKVLKKKTKMIADLKFLESRGFKFKKNEKNFNI
jgi:UDP-glucose 4-epimerase